MCIVQHRKPNNQENLFAVEMRNILKYQVTSLPQQKQLDESEGAKTAHKKIRRKEKSTRKKQCVCEYEYGIGQNKGYVHTGFRIKSTQGNACKQFAVCYSFTLLRYKHSHNTRIDLCALSSLICNWKDFLLNRPFSQINPFTRLLFSTRVLYTHTLFVHYHRIFIQTTQQFSTFDFRTGHKIGPANKFF